MISQFSPARNIRQSGRFVRPDRGVPKKAVVRLDCVVAGCERRVATEGLKRSVRTDGSGGRAAGRSGAGGGNQCRSRGGIQGLNRKTALRIGCDPQFPSPQFNFPRKSAHFSTPPKTPVHSSFLLQNTATYAKSFGNAVPIIDLGGDVSPGSGPPPLRVAPIRTRLRAVSGGHPYTK
jgi:hypothetical protein